MNDAGIYEAPELFELGEIVDLTLGHRWGDWPDGVFAWVFSWATFEDLLEEE